MRSGELLFVALLVITGLIFDSRQDAVPHLPAVAVSGERREFFVTLINGECQYVDTISGVPVMGMTPVGSGRTLKRVSDGCASVTPPEISKNNLSEVGTNLRVIPAGARLALGIPLQPDLMGGDDWEVLPGIGPSRAKAIEVDRQNNGDFGCVDGLQRVIGIGEKRLETLKPYFAKCN